MTKITCINENKIIIVIFHAEFFQTITIKLSTHAVKAANPIMYIIARKEEL